MKLWESGALLIMGIVFLVYIIVGLTTKMYTLQASVAAALMTTIAIWIGMWVANRRQ
jgi:hypothetical protein